MKGIVDETLLYDFIYITLQSAGTRHFEICLFPLDHRTLLMDVDICLLLRKKNLVPKQVWQVPTFEPLLAAAFKKSGMIRVEAISIIFDNEGWCPKTTSRNINPNRSPNLDKKIMENSPGFHPFSTTPCVSGEVTQEWRELRLAKTTESTLPGASEGTGQSVVKVAGTGKLPLRCTKGFPFYTEN